MSAERTFVTEDVSRASLLGLGLLIGLGGSGISLILLEGPWVVAGALGAALLGLLVALRGRTTSFWIEGESVFWGEGSGATCVNIAEADDIRTVFVMKGPRSLLLSRGGVRVEVPIDSSTEPLRREMGRIFRERWPTRVLEDRSAMRALFL